MSRAAVIIVWGAIGAAIGAAAFIPVGYEVRDGGADCTSCGEFTVVLMGAHFRQPYNGPLVAAAGAIVLGALFAFVAWGLVRVFGD